jgi:hypothetical protein
MLFGETGTDLHFVLEISSSITLHSLFPLLKDSCFITTIQCFEFYLELIKSALYLQQMHRVLIPYFSALLVTPSVHSLEGTLLVCLFVPFGLPSPTLMQSSLG